MEQEKNILITIKGEKIKYKGYIDLFSAGQVLAFLAKEKRLKVKKGKKSLK